MSTKPKRLLDGSPRPHPSRSRIDWGMKRASPPTRVHNGHYRQETERSRWRNYSEYHRAENQRARTRAALDITRFKKLARGGHRRELTEARNKYYESLKEKRQ